MELGFDNAYDLRENDGRDMISNLPDSIIGSILSLLPTKDVFRTCVLSKRWKNLWAFVTELSFQEDREIKETQFLLFVHRVVSHLNSLNLSINSFSLSPYYHYNHSHLNESISFLSSLRVKKIRFDSQHVHREFPFDSLSKCESLEELVLVNCRIRVPSFVTLSSLTALNLSLVTVTSYLKDLTLQFPVLRNFMTEECSWLHVKSVTIQAPLLEVVSMDYGRYVGSNTEIKFCASHLTMFSYAGCFVSETISLDAGHIVSANIMLYDSIKSIYETWLFVRKLLSINAASLKLCGLSSKKVLQRVKLSLYDIPDFQILGHLDLDFAPGDILFRLLLKSPRLKTLVLKVDDFGDSLLNSAIMPDCFQFTLKVVKFERFAGTKHELNFVEFVMRNASVLKWIHISRCPELLVQQKWEKVQETISSYATRFKSSAVIAFSSYVI